MGYQALSFLLTFGLNVLVYMFQLFYHSSKFKNILFYLYIYLVYNLAKKRPKYIILVIISLWPWVINPYFSKTKIHLYRFMSIQHSTYFIHTHNHFFQILHVPKLLFYFILIRINTIMCTPFPSSNILYWKLFHKLKTSPLLHYVPLQW